MKKQQKPTSPVMIWCYGLVLILIWLAVSGQTMNQHFHREQQGYSTTLGKETGQWISQAWFTTLSFNHDRNWI